jgi:hypothetical protein
LVILFVIRNPAEMVAAAHFTIAHAFWNTTLRLARLDERTCPHRDWSDLGRGQQQGFRRALISITTLLIRSLQPLLQLHGRSEMFRGNVFQAHLGRRSKPAHLLRAGAVTVSRRGSQVSAASRARRTSSSVAVTVQRRTRDNSPRSAARIAMLSRFHTPVVHIARGP